MQYIKNLVKVLMKRSNVILLTSAVALLLGSFGINFTEAGQEQAVGLVTSLVAVLGIVLGIGQAEKEVIDEVKKAKADKEAE